MRRVEHGDGAETGLAGTKSETRAHTKVSAVLACCTDKLLEHKRETRPPLAYAHNVTLPNASFYNEACLLADHSLTSTGRPLSWFGLVSYC